MSKWDELGSEIGRLIKQKLGEKGIDEADLKALSSKRTFNRSQDGDSGGGKPGDCGKSAFYDELLGKRPVKEPVSGVRGCNDPVVYNCGDEGRFCAYACLSQGDFSFEALTCPSPSPGTPVTCEDFRCRDTGFECPPNSFDCTGDFVCLGAWVQHDSQCTTFVCGSQNTFMCSSTQYTSFSCGSTGGSFSCTADKWFSCVGAGGFQCSHSNSCSNTFNCISGGFMCGSTNTCSVGVFHWV